MCVCVALIFRCSINMLVLYYIIRIYVLYIEIIRFRIPLNLICAHKKAMLAHSPQHNLKQMQWNIRTAFSEQTTVKMSIYHTKWANGCLVLKSVSLNVLCCDFDCGCSYIYYNISYHLFLIQIVSCLTHFWDGNRFIRQ